MLIKSPIKIHFKIDSNSNSFIEGACDAAKCNNGKCVITGLHSFACQCKEGWSGPNCDSEYKAAVGGWIAGIVVLAVLVVVASGVALIFARRFECLFDSIL